MVDTESQMTQAKQDRSLKYAALRVYMMLGSESHYIPEDVSSFYQLTWLQQQAEDLTSEEFAQLSAHIEALFAKRPIPLPVVLDQTLITSTQQALIDAPLVETIYGRLTQTDLSDIPSFNIYDNAGQQLASSVFIRKSGRSLSQGISPLYSKAAYQRIINDEIPKLADEVVKESWVYGENYQHSRAIDKPSLVKGASTLYQQNYIKSYQRLLSDIDIYPYTNYEQAANVLHTLSGESNPSPLVLLLEAVKDETDFGNAELSSTLAGNTKFRQAKDKLQRMIGSSPDIASNKLPKSSHPVSNAFSRLNNLLPENKDSTNAPINKVIDKITELNDYMGRIAATSRDGALEPSTIQAGEEIVQKIKQVAQTQPNLFVAPYLKRMAERVGNLTFGGAMVHINQMWSQGPYETCIASVQDNFPFSQNARSEMPLADFGNIFGYGGVLDAFFTKHLQEYVNTASSPWRVKPSHSKLISISSEALKAFENAHYIRKAFFEIGQNKVNTSFKLKPQELDDGLRGFFLSLDGQEINYEFGPLISEHLTWPGPNPGSGVSMHLRQVDGPNISITEDGDWAWFRLLRKMQVKRAASNTIFNINFKAAGYSAFYELIADKSFSPYRLGSRIPFRCPKAL
jgi:type VI secretion system protein ImpL